MIVWNWTTSLRPYNLEVSGINCKILTYGNRWVPNPRNTPFLSKSQKLNTAMFPINVPDLKWLTHRATTEPSLTITHLSFHSMAWHTSYVEFIGNCLCPIFVAIGISSQKNLWRASVHFRICFNELWLSLYYYWFVNILLDAGHALNE